MYAIRSYYAIEGKRGLPRHRPPYVAQVGLFGRPTLEQNVETLYWVRDIVEKGADWFTSHGRHNRKGLRSFSVSGRGLLGMVILTGNHHSPMTMTKEANMKVYASIDKTVAAVGDEVTYIFSYRNYASVDAEDVVVSCSLPEGLEVVSASNEGKLINGKVEWQIGKVSGFQSARGIASTKGEVTLICKVAADVKGSLITRAEISTSNGQGWISNDYPNNITAVMERNILDVTVITSYSIHYTKLYDSLMLSDADSVKCEQIKRQAH